MELKYDIKVHITFRLRKHPGAKHYDETLKTDVSYDEAVEFCTSQENIGYSKRMKDIDGLSRYPIWVKCKEEVKTLPGELFKDGMDDVLDMVSEVYYIPSLFSIGNL